MINKNFTKALDEHLKFLKKNFIYKKKFNKLFYIFRVCNQLEKKRRD